MGTLNGKTAAALGFAAAALAGAALWNRKRTREAEAAHPPKGKFVEVDGVRLHYAERGDGRPVVMLHGLGALHQDFEASGLIDRASRHYRVLAFDRPGYGYSERPRWTIWTPRAQAALIRDALAKLKIERPILVGHSWGALPALAYALDWPDEVAGLVLLAGYYFPTTRPDAPMLAGPATPLLGDIVAHSLSPLIGRLTRPAVIRTIFAPDPVPERFLALFPIELTLRPRHMQAAAGDAGLLIPGALALAGRYRELKMPVAIVSGTGDRVVSHKAHAERLHATVAGSTLRAVPDGGHMIHHVAPATAMEAIDEVAALSARTAPAVGRMEEAAIH